MSCKGTSKEEDAMQKVMKSVIQGKRSHTKNNSLTRRSPKRISKEEKFAQEEVARKRKKKRANDEDDGDRNHGRTRMKRIESPCRSLPASPDRIRTLIYPHRPFFWLSWWASINRPIKIAVINQVNTSRMTGHLFGDRFSFRKRFSWFLISYCVFSIRVIANKNENSNNDNNNNEWKRTVPRNLKTCILPSKQLSQQIIIP